MGKKKKQKREIKVIRIENEVLKDIKGWAENWLKMLADNALNANKKRIN